MKNPFKKNRDDRQFWQSAIKNKAGYTQYYNRLVELSVSMFDWKDLPDSVDPRFLELALFSEGKCVFFKDDVLGYLTLRCAIGGQFDVYRIPTKRRAFASNGYQMPLDENNSVLIFNNFLHTNSMLDVQIFADRLYKLDQIIEINSNAQKTPILIRCEQNQRLTMENLYKQYDGNVPFIFADSGLNPQSIQVLKTDAPYLCDKLTTLKSQIWNEALTYLGISNINIAKKERMITDEVMRNQGGTIASRYSRLEARRQACEKINKMFGLNISVDYREDFRLSDDIIREEESEEREVMPDE